MFCLQYSICFPLARVKQNTAELNCQAAALREKIHLEDENSAGNVPPPATYSDDWLLQRRFEVVMMLVWGVFLFGRLT